MTEENYELFSKIQSLSSSKLYENPRLSTDGFGTFIDNLKEARLRYEIAKKQWTAQLEVKNKTSVAELLKIFVEFLSIHVDSVFEHKIEYLRMQNSLIGKLEIVNGLCRTYETRELIPIVEWGLINLKLNTLLKESELLSKSASNTCMESMIKSHKEIRYLYEKYLINGIKLVSNEDLVIGIKKKLAENIAY